MTDTKFLRFNMGLAHVVVLPLNSIDDIQSLKVALANDSTYSDGSIGKRSFHIYDRRLVTRSLSNSGETAYETIAAVGDYAVWNQNKVIHIVKNLVEGFTSEHIPEEVLELVPSMGNMR
jgi:hypothetical protein